MSRSEFPTFIPLAEPLASSIAIKEQMITKPITVIDRVNAPALNIAKISEVQPVDPDTQAVNGGSFDSMGTIFKSEQPKMSSDAPDPEELKKQLEEVERALREGKSVTLVERTEEGKRVAGESAKKLAEDAAKGISST